MEFQELVHGDFGRPKNQSSGSGAPDKSPVYQIMFERGLYVGFRVYCPSNMHCTIEVLTSRNTQKCPERSIKVFDKSI